MKDPRISRVRRLDCPVTSFEWGFARDRAEDIAAHWTKLIAQKPALFDGRVLLTHATHVSPADGGVLHARYFETSFSSFIAWRDFGFPDRAIRNGFAMAALRSADGAFLLGEMAGHTANAGMVYFPAGTPDPSDVKNGQVDLAASVARELMEETGLDIADAEIDPVWTIVALGSRVASMRAVRLAASADEIVARVEATLASQETPELAGMRAVRSMADLDRLNAPDFVRAYLDYAFSTS